jgi:hypothetical protein
MEFREFVNLYERIQTRSNPRGDQPGSWGQIGVVIPGGNFGAMPTQWTGSQWGDMPLYSGGFMGSNWMNGKFDLALPSVSKTSQIKFVAKRTNPILVHLADGTRLYMPFDAVRKMNTPPEVGRTMIVTFQRRTDDTSPAPSKIQSIHCY